MKPIGHVDIVTPLSTAERKVVTITIPLAPMRGEPTVRHGKDLAEANVIDPA